MKDYYQVLGVKKDAKEDEIKKVFRKLARQNHPDTHPGDAAAEARFKAVSEAYDTVGDAEKRKQYDAMRENPFAGQNPFANQGGGYQRQAGHGAGGFSGQNANFGGLDDILSSLFRGQTSRAAKGEDLETEAEISLEEVASGASVTVTFQAPNGKRKHLKVPIPAGINTGMRVRVAKEGEPGLSGGAPGDLFVKVTVKPHPRFKREGDDLLLEHHLSIFDAVLGAEITVPTLEGEIKLKVPPGTQGGQTFRLKNKGIPHLKGDSRGALLVKMQLQIPSAIPEGDIKLWRQLADREGKTVPA